MTRQGEERFVTAAVDQAEQSIAQVEQACTTVKGCIKRLQACGKDTRGAELQLLQFEQTLSQLWRARDIFLRRLSRLT